ncbi:hypothetical protein CDL12_05031 [Handroanthus impetiginosus]|uniref:Uncharacterized protein n=1 Tax=Handroanthus impetiginosus TaxID=429701 RepID=A0A2G9HXN9_9LAMI|nr:hypothetical protein CDL12_05031 [Handroanthus impetiginosus]
MGKMWCANSPIWPKTLSVPIIRLPSFCSIPSDTYLPPTNFLPLSFFLSHTPTHT